MQHYLLLRRIIIYLYHRRAGTPWSLFPLRTCTNLGWGALNNRGVGGGPPPTGDSWTETRLISTIDDR